MMSPKRWILLLIFYISYLMFGASIYYHIEHNLEKHRRAEALQQRIEINEYLVDQLSSKNESAQNEILEKVTDYCGKPVTNYTLDQYEDPYIWTFYHSFFFAFTVCSTVGYGNLSPTTTLGRMIMIAYSIIGMPINGILFTGLGEYFGKTFEMIYKRYKKYKLSNDVRYVPPQLGLLATVLIALIPGITFFILLPSWVFSYFEDWPYTLSIYYSYVTTTTIGFGDYVPTFQPHQGRTFGGWFVVYQIFIIVWFIFSLGYLLMIMTFITKGLRSKKLARLEQQLSSNIKATQNRIWNGVTKDVGYLRRILNELYIMKFKPVYNEPIGFYLPHRSISCPELQMYRIDPPVISRKRAFSESYDVYEGRTDATPPMRTSSDTELDKFDKQKTFETAETFRQTTDLLAKVVSALAKIKPLEEDTTVGSAGMYGGYHGFSDSQILSSEWSFPATGGEIPRRGRACSDFNINPKHTVRPPSHEWTWSGDNNQIQQAINDRVRIGQATNGNLYNPPVYASKDYSNIVVNIDEEEPTKRRKKFSIPESVRRLFKKRPSQEFISASGRKFSIVSVPEKSDKPPKDDYYSTITAGDDSSPYFKNGGSGKIFTNGIDRMRELFTSDASMLSKLSTRNERSGSVLDFDESDSASYQKGGGKAPVQPGLRKRRESLFTQNPAINNRRGSIFPSNVSAAAAAINNRRGSLYTEGRSSGGRSETTTTNRRLSLFSVPSEEDLNVLENTTIADLIRYLEVMHTQDVLQPTAEELFNDNKKKRKMGNAGFSSTPIAPLDLSSSNRLYSRRSTIVGTMSPNTLQGQTLSSSPSSVLTRRRQSSVQMTEPPPSYSETETPKFKRRFSIRPTDLQIPPGKAPPPGVSINSILQSAGQSSGSSTMPPTTSQTALQRRISLRPSPLAREFNFAESANSSGRGTTGGQPMSSTTSTTRLLSPGSRTGTTTSSTHSPLSRIALISEAQRKSSMPDRYNADKS